MKHNVPAGSAEQRSEEKAFGQTAADIVKPSNGEVSNPETSGKFAQGLVGGPALRMAGKRLTLELNPVLLEAV